MGASPSSQLPAALSARVIRGYSSPSTRWEEGMDTFRHEATENIETRF